MSNDIMIHGMLCDRALRFAAIDGTELVRTAQKTHRLSRVATAALGRQLMMTSVVATLCKNDTDTVTTVLAGSGPSGNLVCVGRHGGLVKGYATNPWIELPLRADGKLDVSGYVGTTGKLTLIRDLGLKEPYVGMCNLVSGEIAEDFAQYFTASEQQPSIVYLGVHENAADGFVTGAGGLLIQTMPNCPDEAIDRVLRITDRIPMLGMRLADGETLEAIVKDLFSDLDAEYTDRMAPAFLCDCTQERLERALFSIGKQDLTEIIEQDGHAELTCQFCGKTYHFDRPALEALLIEANDNGGNDEG
ncbi:MAG: Hsp33 family molecular chaperone HslO [Clostridia bacterium]|nr:Hsp33 family molecular chaperone HslO [Clostridia bacterium]